MKLLLSLSPELTWCCDVWTAQASLNCSHKYRCISVVHSIHRCRCCCYYWRIQLHSSQPDATKVSRHVLFSHGGVLCIHFVFCHSCCSSLRRYETPECRVSSASAWGLANIDWSMQRIHLLWSWLQSEELLLKWGADTMAVAKQLKVMKQNLLENSKCRLSGTVLIWYLCSSVRTKSRFFQCGPLLLGQLGC